MTPEPATYPGYRFPAEIISYAVWLYHVFGLSLREVERGGSVSRYSVSVPMSGSPASWYAHLAGATASRRAGVAQPE